MSDGKRNDYAFTADSPYGIAEEATYAGALSFLRRKYTRDLDGVDVAVSGIPLDSATSNRPGARFGPRAIRAASASLAWTRPWPWESDALAQLAVVDYGDCAFDFGRPEEIPAKIQAHAEHILGAGATLLTLGGDHFVSYPLLRAHAGKHGALSLIHFDAHSDTWPDEAGRVDHGTMFFHAANEGVVQPARSAQVGLRTTNDDTLGFNVLDARHVHAVSAGDVAAQIKQIVGQHPVYLTFDIDCLDPSFAPGTGTPVCGGLSSFQALEIVRALAGINLVGMDVVEVAPAYDVGEITALAAASLAFEFLHLYAANPLRPGGQSAAAGG